MSQVAREHAAQLLTSLKAPIDSVEALTSLLLPPLQALDLVDFVQGQAEVSTWTTLDYEDKLYIASNALAGVQELLITKIAVDWYAQIQANALQDTIWTPYFCPRKTADSAKTTLRIRTSISAYSVLLNAVSSRRQGSSAGLSSTAVIPLSPHPVVLELAMSALAKLSGSYGLQEIYKSLISNTTSPRAMLDWQAFVTLYLSIPARAANAVGQRSDGRVELFQLQWKPFYTRASQDFECLATNRHAPQIAFTCEALTYALTKLLKSGFFTAGPYEESFWSVTMPSLRRLFLRASTQANDGQIWQSLVRGLTSSDLTTFASSFFGFLNQQTIIEEDGKAVKQCAILCQHIFGSLESKEDHLWDIVVSRCLLGRPQWRQGVARVIVAWTMETKDADSMPRLLESVSKIWCRKEVIERAPIFEHTYLSALLALTIKALPVGHRALVQLSQLPAFLQAVTLHLSSLRPTVRFLGMMVAELLSQRTIDPAGSVKPLDFADIWEEEAEGVDVVKRLRLLLTHPPDWDVQDWELPQQSTEQSSPDGPSPVDLGLVDSRLIFKSSEVNKTENREPSTAKIQILSSSLADEYADYDSEEELDLQPYSLPNAPADEDLKDLEDASAYTPKKKKVKPPVYIADLSQLLKSHEDAEKIDIGLKEAEALIRRKANWGTELYDNAVDLAITLAGLQDNFDLKDFEDNRRRALTALVYCCPTRVAPCLIEQYFSHHYSTAQRFAMLSSLAISGRELAGLPSLESQPTTTMSARQAPSQTHTLPPQLHQHFLSNEQRNAHQQHDSTSKMDLIMDNITNTALARTRESAESTLPGVAREKLLTVKQKKQSSIRLNQGFFDRHSVRDIPPQFADLAVENYIMPLLNRFWLYLRDISTSPQDRKFGTYAGGSAGTAALLEPIILSKYFATMAVLVDAARNSPHFLAVIAPETLELVLALRGMDTGDESVRSSMLQLTLVVLDTSTKVDGGRTLARDNSRVVWQIKDWAEASWNEKEEQGGQVDTIARVAAGVLLKIDEVVKKTIGYR